MSKTKGLFRTATVIIAGAMIVSGVNSAIASNDDVETLARMGVADVLVELVLTKY